jgi:hypothetical protein
MIRLFALVTIGFVAIASGAAKAETITFGNEDDLTVYGDYSESGYLFTNGNLNTWGNLSSLESDASNSNTLFTNLGGTTTITRLDGKAFDLASIDFDDVYNSGSPSGLLSFDWTLAGGGTGTGSFSVDAIPGLVTAFIGLTNLASFSFTPDSNLIYVQFDNAQVSTVVTTPIPPALPLVAAALAGLGVIGRRRKQDAGAA